VKTFLSVNSPAAELTARVRVKVRVRVRVSVNKNNSNVVELTDKYSYYKNSKKNNDQYLTKVRQKLTYTEVRTK